MCAEKNLVFFFPSNVRCSIQRAAVRVLDQYYSDFPVYNPGLLNLPKTILSKKMSAFKVYDLGEGKFIGSLQHRRFTAKSLQWANSYKNVTRFTFNEKISILFRRYQGV